MCAAIDESRVRSNAWVTILFKSRPIFLFTMNTKLAMKERELTTSEQEVGGGDRAGVEPSVFAWSFPAGRQVTFSATLAQADLLFS